MRKVLLVLMLLFLSAAPLQALTILPESSFWDGYTYYDNDEDNVSIRIEYAVYDTQSEGYSNEFTGADDGFVNPGEGRYIYAYQIFTNPAEGYNAVSEFIIPGIDIDLAAITGIGSQDDGDGGLEPDNDGATLVWSFGSFNLVMDEHSFFIVFSSDTAPVVGTYEITVDVDGFPTPGDGDDVPEPTSIALFTLGFIAVLKKRKKV